jgi:hypothetical protein
MSFIQPILKETVISPNPDDLSNLATVCTHPESAQATLTIKRKKSNDPIRKWLAIEIIECRFCGSRIEKRWLTAYKDYQEGMEAIEAGWSDNVY